MKRLTLLVLLSIVVFPGLVLAESPSTLDATYEGWYVVRPGDTLQGITERYLGSADRWRETWRLNPEVQEPDRIAPGTRLRILLHRLPRDGALVTQVSKRVEDQMPPRPWDPTEENTVLQPRDSVRTFAASSAALRFGDETELFVSEESLIFLDRQTLPAGSRTTAATTERDQIEIVSGQADLSRSTDVTSAADEIELVIGTAVAQPRPTPEGGVQTRARKAGNDAQLMVYVGESSLAAAGVEIEVPQGMGSATTEGAPPGPPEKLLDAPTIERPPQGARLATPRPVFAWQPVAGAVGYTLEICRDRQCGALVLRNVLEDGALEDGALEGGDLVGDPANGYAWQPRTPLPVDDLHWRVTARSPTGLDGYPSEAAAFAVLTDQEDTQPPRVSFRVDGPHLPPRPQMNERWILGPGAGLVAIAEDAGSGVDRLTMELDGVTVEPSAWQGPWQPGPHVLSFTAFDRAGQRSAHESIPIIYDVAPPDFTWGVEGVGRLGEVEARRVSTDGLDPWPVPKVKRTFTVDDPQSWLPWRKQTWTVFHDGRHVLLRPSDALSLHLEKGFGGHETVRLGPDRGLWVRVLDAVCRDDFRLEHRLSIRPRRADGEKQNVLTLEMRALDAVGNGALAELEMATAPPGE